MLNLSRCWSAVWSCVGPGKHVLDGTTWQIQLNGEPSMCRCDEAFLRNYFDHLLLVLLWSPSSPCLLWSRGSLKIQDAKNRHLGTIAQLCLAVSSQLRHVSTIETNLLNSVIHMSSQSVNFGPVTAETCWRVWGTPANFNGFHILAALLHGTLVVAVSQTLWRWTEGATYIR